LKNPLEIRPVQGRRELKRFIHLPAQIHRNHPNWVPPLYSDDWTFFNPKKNKAFGYSDVLLLLAWRKGKVVGRIMGLINREYNRLRGERNARFNFLECWDELEVSTALLQHVEVWARDKGMEKIVGPLGFSDKDPQGFLIKGLHEPVSVATHCNFPFLTDHLKALGYDKDLDLVVYKFHVPEALPEMYMKVAERARTNNAELRLLDFRKRKELKPLIRPIFGLVNETFQDIYGFMPFTLEEMDDFANRYLLLMDPRYIKAIADKEGKPVAFVIAMPDISKGIQRSRGYVLPLGILHILRSGKRTRQLNLLLGAVHPAYQNRGLDAILGSALLLEARKGGFKVLDSHLEMESNTRVRAQMEYMGGEVYKVYRVFGKAL